AEADPATLARSVDVDKGHGRVEERRLAVLRDVDWLSGDRRFPGELRLPGVAAIVRVETVAHLADRSRTDTRYFISSAALTPERAA
ncbi:ISAs1 family transposase, partial [Mycobacterium tuberculosis]|nr:ISAs1 family transposase [Mycobacterium tuberculosis]